jgi:tRNA U54 and U55 pseudouridine synthase Pus10
MTRYDKPAQYKLVERSIEVITYHSLTDNNPTEEVKPMGFVVEEVDGKFLEGGRPEVLHHYFPVPREQLVAELEAEGYREIAPDLFQAEGKVEDLSDLFS